jgi:GT2 family glycosyltransferase
LLVDFAEATGVSVVLPTYNRVEALRETFPLLLELREIAEIIVVNDGSTDETDEYLAGQVDPRLRVIRHSERLGSPAARNSGVAVACTDWILFAEDDCVFPSDYAAILVQEAWRTKADVIAAPWLRAVPGQEEAALTRARRAATDDIGLRSHPGTMPSNAVVTPFLPALALVRRRVFERLEFDEGFGGNAYREETDFFVSATRDGFRCVLTSATAHYQHKIWTGGQKSARLSYELAALRNNWRFLDRHGEWLRENAQISGKSRAQVRFAADRLRALAAGFVRSHFVRSA